MIHHRTDDTGTTQQTTTETVGEAFARALAARDRAGLVALLTEDLDFEALTPRRHWVATTASQAVDEVMLRHWLGPDDVVLSVGSISSGRVVDRQRVGYRLAVRRDGQDHILEQQAYYVSDGRQISWIRILCSGYRPADVELVNVPGEHRDQQKEMQDA